MSGYLGTKAVLLSTTSATVGGDSSVGGDSTIGGDLTVDTNTLYVDSTNNRVGIGTASPTSTASAGPTLEISGTAGGNLVLSDSNATTGQRAKYFLSQGGALYIGHSADDGTSPVNDLVINSSGQLLINKTTNSIGTAGTAISATLGVRAAVDGDIGLLVNRLTSDGNLIDLRKDGTTVGSIGTYGGAIYIASPDGTDAGLRIGNGYIAPVTTTGALRDNAIDVGYASGRFDDIYATNGTIQTSDQNEKQQIASLTDAEMTAAKAISKLFKTFKWNDSVAEKGDAARTHAGVIAQEVEQAMSDAGLNAGDYAFFISSDWTDEETGEERNRKGIRYPQLMSFIGAATEQRLASIEARLDALEGN
jgi:hypothetical protein